MQTIPVDPFDAPILGKIHQITLPTPFPVGPVHVYLLEDEPLTLVDTGPSTPEAEEALCAGLAGLGYAVPDLQRIVVTHAHSDHFGLVGRLAEASGAEVLAHPLAQPIVEGWETYRAMRDGFWYETLIACGVPPARCEATAVLYGSFRDLQTHGPLTSTLSEGDTLSMAGATWQVLHCPGHSGNLICFYEPASRLLIGNDHLLAHISSNALVEPPVVDGPRRKPLVDYWASLCRVYEMDIALVLTGHGHAVADHRGLIKSRFGFYERRLGRLRADLHDGPRSVWQLAEALFRRLDAVDTFLAASEVIGHLDVLEQQGEVRVWTDEDGVWRYAPQSTRYLSLT